MNQEGGSLARQKSLDNYYPTLTKHRGQNCGLTSMIKEGNLKHQKKEQWKV